MCNEETVESSGQLRISLSALASCCGVEGSSRNGGLVLARRMHQPKPWAREETRCFVIVLSCLLNTSLRPGKPCSGSGARLSQKPGKVIQKRELMQEGDEFEASLEYIANARAA